ncbi:MATE family efflux transporter [Nonlabens ulvanivorans]|uniref:MATE family efflux transporter n=1 Tax=Nonlabens ulvanivorans TaxID=906888 RepID=UPI0037CC1010
MPSTNSITPRNILSLAIPAIIAGIAEPLISLTDVAVIGNMKDNAVEGLLAVGLVGSFLSAIIWTLAQTKTSISSIVSNALGSDQLNKIDSLIPQVIWINIGLGILIYLVTAPLASWIFTLYNAKGITLNLSISYYQIRAIGFPLTLSAFAIFGIFRGIQNTSWAMIASISGAIVNVILDYTLVYGIDSLIPAYGVMGAAYASLAAQIVMLIIALYFLYQKTPFRLHQLTWKPHPKLRKHIILTANFFLRTVAINVAIFLSYRYASGYGDEYGATHAILMNIWLFFSFFIDGFASAGNAIGGKLLGSKNVQGLQYLGKTTTTYGIIVALILITICGLFYKTIGHQFTDNETVFELFLSTFWIVLIMQPINAVAFVFDGIFKGWGEASYLRNLLFGLTAFVFIPALLILDYVNFQLNAIWVAFGLWMLGRAAILPIKFHLKIKTMQN